MKLTAVVLTTWLATLLLSPFLMADEEASNSIRVAAETWGAHYAKSIPADSYGSRGVTRIYLATPDQDELETTFNWYSSRIYLQGGAWGTSVVRLGSWSRGQKASADAVAIGFYLNGKTLREYSTLDIAGQPGNVSSSVSHYRVIDKIDGYKWMGGNDYSFCLTTSDGRAMSFDTRTGQVIQPTTQPVKQP